MTSSDNKKLKVIRIVPALDFGGVESRVVLLSSLIDRDRFEFSVCTFGRAGAAAKRIEGLGIPVHVLDVDPAIRNPKAPAALFRFLRATQPDVVHASAGEGMFHTALAASAARVPVRIIEDIGVPDRSPVARRIFGGLTRLVHATVGVSQTVCDYLTNEEGGVRVRRIYGCGKPSYFEPMSRTWTVDASRPFRILHVGRLVAEKNQERLVHAFAKAVERGLDGELWIAGEGHKRPVLEQAIANLGVTDRVKLLGFRDDIQELMNDADLFVLPSLTEGCSVTLIEAMATGIPVLASDIPPNHEVLLGLGATQTVGVEDIDGWADALLTASQMGTDDRRALGLSLRDVAERNFSPTTHLNNVQSMYTDLYAVHG